MGAGQGVVQAGFEATLEALSPLHDLPDQGAGGVVRTAGTPKGSHPMQHSLSPLEDVTPLDTELRAAVKELCNGRAGGGYTMRA